MRCGVARALNNGSAGHMHRIEICSNAELHRACVCQELMKVSGIVFYLLLLYSDENFLKRGNSSLDEWTQLFSQLHFFGLLLVDIRQ